MALYCTRTDCTLFDPCEGNEHCCECRFCMSDGGDCPKYINKSELSGKTAYVVFGHDSAEDIHANPLKVFFNKKDAEEYVKWSGMGYTYVEPADFSDRQDYTKITGFRALVWFTDNGYTSPVHVYVQKSDHGTCYHENTLEDYYPTEDYVLWCVEEFDHEVNEGEVIAMMKKRTEKIRDYVLANLHSKYLNDIEKEIRYMK